MSLNTTHTNWLTTSYSSDLQLLLKIAENDPLRNGVLDGLLPSRDTVAIPASLVIGYGYDLVKNRLRAFSDLSSSSVGAQITNAGQLQQELLALTPGAPVTAADEQRFRQLLSLPGEPAATALLQLAIADRAAKFDVFLNAYGIVLPESKERVALMSMWYQGGESYFISNGLPSNLTIALMTGNRAEAWYEIRYQSKKNGSGVIPRRYADAQLFGLYENATLTTEEALSIYKMFTEHRLIILQHEQQYGGLIGGTNTQYTGVGVQDLVVALDSAAQLLIAQYAPGRTDISALDILVGGAGMDRLLAQPRNGYQLNTGSTGAYLIIGAEGADWLVGGTEADVLVGGVGADTLNGGVGNDVYRYSSGDGTDTVVDDNDGTIVVDGLQLSGVGAKFFTNSLGRPAWQWTSGLQTFVYTLIDGDTTNGGTLWITGSGIAPGDHIAISNFVSGDLGLALPLATQAALLPNSNAAAYPFWDPNYTPSTQTGALQEARALVFTLAFNSAVLATAGATAVVRFSVDALASYLRLVTGADTLEFQNGAVDVTLEAGQTAYTFSLVSQGDVDVSQALNFAATVLDAQGVPTLTSAAMTVNFSAANESGTANTIYGDIGGSKSDVLYGQTSGSNTLVGGALGDIELGHDYDDVLFGESIVDVQSAIAAGASGAGTPGLISISVAAGGEFLSGDGGNDVLVGGSTADMLAGGAGDDLLVGGAGDDYLVADDRFYGIGVDDPPDWTLTESVVSGAHVFTMLGDGLQGPFRVGSGSDVVHAGGGDDVVFAGAGNDQVYGEEGDDAINGGLGNDTLLGGDGDDAIGGDGDITGLAPVSSHGDDFIDGGTGNDFLAGEGGSDTVYGGSGNDVLYGDIVDTNAGNDYLNGEDGADTLYGAAGADTLVGGAGDDILYGDSSTTAAAVQGDDRLDGGDGADQLYGGGGSDSLVGGAGNDLLHGDDANTASTAIGKDFLDGGAGSDTLVGGGGDDTLIGGADDDFLYGEFSGTAEGLEGDDYLDGGSGNDLLVGGGGADTLLGGAGNDQLFGEDATTPLAAQLGDYLDGGDGDDILQGNGGNDTLLGGNGNDLLAGSEGDDYLDGGAGIDELQGGDGNDRLVGGAGDILFGGAGDDTYLVDDGATIADSEGANTIVANLATAASTWLFVADSLPTITNSAGQVITLTHETLEGQVALDLGAAGVFDSGEELIAALYRPTSLADPQFDPFYNVVSLGATVRAVDIGLLTRNQDLVLTYSGQVTDWVDVGALRARGALVSERDGTYYGLASGTHTLVLHNWYLSNRYDYLGLFLDDTNTATNFAAPAIGMARVYLGTASADVLLGSEGVESISGLAGDDDISTLEGNDTLAGGAGDDSLQGGQGDDTYIFNLGDGADYIYEDSGLNDVLKFGPGILPGDVAIAQDGSDVIFQVGPAQNGDSVRILNWHYSESQDIERVEFSNGAVWSPLYVDQQLTGNHRPRVVNAIGNQTAIRDEIFSLLIPSNTFADPNAGDQLTLSVTLADGSALPSWLSFDAQTSTLFGTPTETDSGLLDYRITATDPSGLTTSLVLSIDVPAPIVLNGNNSNNTLTATTNDDYRIYGFDGDDVLQGAGGRDRLYGGFGNDTLNGGAGADLLNGGAGGDIYYVDNMGDVVIDEDDGSGNTVISSISYVVQAGTPITSVRLTGTNAIDATGNEYTVEFIGNDASNTLSGGNPLSTNILVGYGGADTLIGGGGNDYFSVDAWNLVSGADLMIGGAGEDRYEVDDAGDIVVELSGEGYDWIWSRVSYVLPDNVEDLLLVSEAGASTATGNSQENFLDGNEFDNFLYGMGFGDFLFGYDGNDTLDGGTGADEMEGGAGNDIYYVDDAGDLVIENAAAGTDEVRSSLTYTLSSELENLTLLGSASINGTGNSTDNILVGNAGNNVLTGAGGNDTLDPGSAGTDSLSGGQGNDTYIVSRTTGITITESAGQGTDLVQSSVTYTLGSNVENLTLTGVGAINGTGNTLVNVLTGNAANNVLDGGAGADTMLGGGGDDTYIVDNASDVTTENASEGIDLVQSAVTRTLGNNIENLTLTGSSATNGTGNTLDNILIGNSGSNTLTGLAGNDTLDAGSAGTDVLVGGQGNDTYIIGRSTGITVTENASEGTDLVQASVTYTLGTNLENLTLTGSTAINGTGNTVDNILVGNSGNNTLTGLAGNDTLDPGSAGTDSLVGGQGNDTYIVGRTTGITITENASEGTDLVMASVTYTLGTNVENLTLTGTSAINGTGNAAVNVLTGNSGNNTLDGGTGADTLIGGAGNDIYVVDNAADITTENSAEGIDLVNASVTYTLLNNVENLTLTGTTAINGTGNALDNVLTGNSGNNTLTGLAGNDTLDPGSAGTDTLVGGQGNDTYIVTRTTGIAITENAAEGTDTVQSSVVYTLGTNLENLTLTGSSAVNGTGNTVDNVLIGNSGINTLTGLAGNDTLDGGAGADTMVGGQGNDIYYVDVSGDVTTEAANEGIDTVNAGITLTLAANIEILFQTGTSAINGTGNALANLLRGNTGVSTLAGGGGTDILEGGDGNDILSNSSGNTLLNGGIGTDTLTGTANNDLLIGGTGNDAITTGTGADILAFNAGHGQDTVAVSTTQDNTVSLGGGILYSDLLFQKSGANLILLTGGGNQITFTNYYGSASNRSVDILQIVIENTSDYNAGSGNAMNNKKIESFDFDNLVAAFDAALVLNPGLTSWALTNALLTQHLGGSDTAARGGDLGYRYGLTGSLSEISFTPATGILAAGGFGSTAQTLQSLGSLQDSTARLQ